MRRLPKILAAEHFQRNGHEPSRLRAALESGGGSLKSLTVLAPQNDPFRVDTDAGHRDGAWLANTLDRLGITGQRHLRGLHYILIGQPKPNGEPYTNTDSDWLWLGMAAKSARWLRYIPFNRIVDQRNDEPEITLWSPSSADRRPYVSVNFDVNFDVVRCRRRRPDAAASGLPGSPPTSPTIWCWSARSPRYARCSALSPTATRADLYLPTGEISDTQAYYRMA